MTIRSLLCPVDFSPTSEEALRYAVSLAAALRAAEVHVLHVYQPPMAGFLDGAVLPPALAETKRRAERELEDLVKRYCAHDVALTPHLVEGVPYQVIVDQAQALGVDLVVMGTHGRSLLTHVLLGSVTERVVRLSAVPVCTVRAAARAPG